MLSEQLLPKSSGDSQPEVPPWEIEARRQREFRTDGSSGIRAPHFPSEEA